MLLSRSSQSHSQLTKQDSTLASFIVLSQERQIGNFMGLQPNFRQACGQAGPQDSSAFVLALIVL